MYTKKNCEISKQIQNFSYNLWDSIKWTDKNSYNKAGTKFTLDPLSISILKNNEAIQCKHG